MDSDGQTGICGTGVCESEHHSEKDLFKSDSGCLPHDKVAQISINSSVVVTANFDDIRFLSIQKDDNPNHSLPLSQQNYKITCYNALTTVRVSLPYTHQHSFVFILVYVSNRHAENLSQWPLSVGLLNSGSVFII